MAYMIQEYEDSTLDSSDSPVPASFLTAREDDPYLNKAAVSVNFPDARY